MDWAKDIRPLLGNRAVVGVPAAVGLSRGSPPVVAVGDLTGPVGSSTRRVRLTVRQAVR